MSTKVWWWLARILDWFAWPFQWPGVVRDLAWEKWNYEANKYWQEHPEEKKKVMDELKKDWAQGEQK